MESDLYEMNFDPVAGPWEFSARLDEDYFNVMDEQKNAAENNAYNNDIRAEHDKLLKADLLIFHFPMWWWSSPAILKGWFDRVLTNGFAYGGKALLKDKKALLVITAETSGEKFTDNYRSGKDILVNIEEGTLKYVGLEIIPAFVAHSIYKISPAERELYLPQYKEYLAQVITSRWPR